MAVFNYSMHFWAEIGRGFFNKALEPGNYTVVDITDGDTFRVTHKGKSAAIRLLGVDTPEMAQNYGMIARLILSDLVLGKTVYISHCRADRFRRTVALVYSADYCINSEMVRIGAAWVSLRYCPVEFRESWQLLENCARLNKKGLWSFDNPIRPSQWRHR